MTTTNPLTDRETQVLQGIANGLTYFDIAEQLHVSRETVAKHAANLIRKLEAGNRTHAVVIALRAGLL